MRALTAAAQVTSDNWPGYVGCCLLVLAVGAGLWKLIRREW